MVAFADGERAGQPGQELKSDDTDSETTPQNVTSESTGKCFKTTFV